MDHTSIPLGIITTLITLITILGNLATLISLKRCHAFNTTQKPLLVILSLLNLFIGVFHTGFVSLACFQGGWLDMDPSVPHRNLEKIYLHGTWCAASAYLLFPLINLTTVVVTLISLERFVALKFAMTNMVLTRGRTVRLLVCACVMVGLITGFEMSRDQTTIYFVPSYQCVPNYSMRSDILTVLCISLVFKGVCFVIVLLVNLYTLIRIIKIKRYRSVLQSSLQSVTSAMHEDKVAMVTITVLLITTLDTLTWLPLYILSIVRNWASDSFNELSPDVRTTLRITAWWLLYISPALNPLLYVFRYRTFRHDLNIRVRSSLRRMSRIMSTRSSIHRMSIVIGRFGTDHENPGFSNIHRGRSVRSQSSHF